MLIILFPSGGWKSRDVVQRRGGCCDGLRPVMSTARSESAGASRILLADAGSRCAVAGITAARPQAKSLLQAEHAMTEDQAHRWLQKTAMDWRLPLHGVCQAVIAGNMRPGTRAGAGGPRFIEAARTLRKEITTGTRSSGSHVTIADVQKAHGISRKCARKAIRELVSEGLLQLRAQQPEGYYVTAEPQTRTARGLPPGTRMREDRPDDIIRDG
jgi:hypothetical protein